MESEVKNMITRASVAAVAHDAMQLSQAALNAANALRVLADTKATHPGLDAAKAS
ncbi:MAG TPA: hypothetical protein VN815_18350 [Steroidobacteraceae bacterium]|nr:hypothetical protein [Steroidobacteraceae bacterium]